MKGLLCLYAAALVLMLAMTARAAPPPPVQSALASLQQGGSELASGWRYQQTIKGSNGSLQLAWDPTRKQGQRWRVIAIDGKAPSDAQRQRLSTQAAKMAKAAGKGLEIGSGWLAASDYRLVKTSDDTLVYQIRPQPVKGADEATSNLLGHLVGKLVIAKDDHRPLSLRLDNFESFSPRFGVTITAFEFVAQFKRLKVSGPVVVVRTSNSVNGEVFWFKDFEDSTEVVLSHFAPVATTAPSAQSGGGNADQVAPRHSGAPEGRARNAKAKLRVILLD